MHIQGQVLKPQATSPTFVADTGSQCLQLDWRLDNTIENITIWLDDAQIPVMAAILERAAVALRDLEAQRALSLDADFAGAEVAPHENVSAEAL